MLSLGFCVAAAVPAAAGEIPAGFITGRVIRFPHD